MSEYALAVEDGCLTLPELFPLYAQHYHEMEERLKGEGIEVSAFDPQIEQYMAHWRNGSLINYTVRLDGKAVGYSNVYLAKDMHNGDPIAQEDTIFVTKSHRNGIGKKLVQFVLADLKARGVKRVHITAMTDVRVVPLWKRMGFKAAATAMIYTF